MKVRIRFGMTKFYDKIVEMSTDELSEILEPVVEEKMEHTGNSPLIQMAKDMTETNIERIEFYEIFHCDGKGMPVR